ASMPATSGAPSTTNGKASGNGHANDARAAAARAVHRLRIAGKRCRYGVEFFAPLLREGATRRYLEQLSSLQDELGRDNDLVVADRLLQQCKQDSAAAHTPSQATSLAALPYVRGYLRALHVQDAAALLAACDAVRHSSLPRLS
ncbi:MAG TPA: CHAD domain-containing protein, partial [Burkholderiaceae bacterium]|nr:CHAD domain-containing protein [Burkholderiaceae bacterium]